MKLTHTIKEVRAISRSIRDQGKTLGLVPTMGALHEGHLSLVGAARAKADVVAVSIFVNPTQFGLNEDFTRYPRNLESDCALLEREGVDVVFAPAVEELYPIDSGSVFPLLAKDARNGAPSEFQAGQGNVYPVLPKAGGSGAPTSTWITVEGLSDRLCGKSRPGHFRGVATVVAKLFNIVEPDFAVFGQKDAAQVAIIRRMVRDLNFPVGVEVCPIVRESDGLALSSRNAYLSPEERKMALVLYASLQRAQKVFADGERDAAKIASEAKKAFLWQPAVRLDYFEIVDPDDLEPVAIINKGSLVAVAAFVGNTRLIDNIFLEP